MPSQVSSVTYSRRVRFMFPIMLLLVSVELASDYWAPRAGSSWFVTTLWVLAAFLLLVSMITSFVRVSDARIVYYMGMGKLESSWDNVEGVRNIEIGRRNVRCIVLRTPGTRSGWYWAEEWLVPREYRGRIIQMPEDGPNSFHGGDRLLAEIQKRISVR